MDKNTFKQLVAEFLGTFTLTLVVLVSINNPQYPIATPLLAALTLGLFVITIGKVSGCHINPAVTLALLSIKEISQYKAFLYIIAQIFGAILARLLVTLMIPGIVLATAVDSLPIAIFEFIGATLFVFGIASVVYKRTTDTLSAPVIGLSLLLGISVAAIRSNAVLNPAVAIGINSISLTYIIAPIIGAVATMHIYNWLIKK